MNIRVSAQLWKLEKDFEGEVTLIFKIPSCDMPKAIFIPEQQELKLDISPKKKVKGEHTL